MTYNQEISKKASQEIYEQKFNLIKDRNEFVSWINIKYGFIEISENDDDFDPMSEIKEKNFDYTNFDSLTNRDFCLNKLQTLDNQIDKLHQLGADLAAASNFGSIHQEIIE